jgi:hypothetical protein
MRVLHDYIKPDTHTRQWPKPSNTTAVRVIRE